MYWKLVIYMKLHDQNCHDWVSIINGYNLNQWSLNFGKWFSWHWLHLNDNHVTFPYPLVFLWHPLSLKEKENGLLDAFGSSRTLHFQKNILFWNWSCLGFNQQVLSRLEEPLDRELANKKSWPDPQQQPVFIIFSKLEMVGHLF